MRTLISGATGLIGSALAKSLQDHGHEVVRLVRTAESGKARDIYWNPTAGILEQEQVEGFDAVVHLAGENLASGRWTEGMKSRIRNSRVEATRFLVEKLCRAQHRPKVLACASGVGFYGNRGDERLTEESQAGRGFLADLSQEWEGAALPAANQGIRVAFLRFGIVLAREGGALAKMLLPFKLGLGGVVGNGRQFWSWISLEDALAAIEFILMNEALRGPVNCVAPQPVTNHEFTKTLGAVLRRPTVFPLPALAAKLLFGEMAEEALLASSRVVPAKLLSVGFQFRHSELASALRALFG